MRSITLWRRKKKLTDAAYNIELIWFSSSYDKRQFIVRMSVDFYDLWSYETLDDEDGKREKKINRNEKRGNYKACFFF